MCVKSRLELRGYLLLGWLIGADYHCPVSLLVGYCPTPAHFQSMNKTEYNNAFNQGVEASAKSLEKFLVQPKEGKILTDAENKFNQLIEVFVGRIEEQAK